MCARQRREAAGRHQVPGRHGLRTLAATNIAAGESRGAPSVDGLTAPSGFELAAAGPDDPITLPQRNRIEPGW